MSCSENCTPCKARENYICHGDFFTTGAYASLIEYFDIHGVSFNQKVDSVKPQLDVNTIQILKVLICDSNRWDYSTNMEIMYLLDEIMSRLSNDNTETNSFNSYVKGDDTNV